MRERRQTVHKERALLVGVYLDRRKARDIELLDELGRLADTAGAEVVGRIEQVRESADPATCIGKGKVEEIAEEVKRLGADVAIFDIELTPTQVRNLEKALNIKVVDRTELILDIFALHARTRPAQLQVELAQLEYTAPRLVHMWEHLERTAGGIGTRGPGERQLESDRRLIQHRIIALKRRLQTLMERRVREVRGRTDEMSVALVGYTNAGKSSIMNALTNADVKVDDALFITLDTRTRKWQVDDFRGALLSDTVGFIRKLPHHLVTSFHATLEEVRNADLLLHVVDVSSPQATEQCEIVKGVLADLGCADKPALVLLNKCDLMKDDSVLPLFTHDNDAVMLVSAKTGAGLDELRRKVGELMDKSIVRAQVAFHPGNGRLQAFLGSRSRILERNYSDSEGTFRVLIKRSELDMVRKLGGVVKDETPAKVTT